MVRYIFKIKDILCFVITDGLIYSGYIVDYEGNKSYLQNSYALFTEALSEVEKLAKMRNYEVSRYKTDSISR